MISKTTGRVVAAAFLLLTMSGPAAAQWPAVLYGAAEIDTEGAGLLFGGFSASPARKGIVPMIGAQAYYLTYDGGTDRVNSGVVRPFIGLSNSYTGGSVHAAVGYAFASDDAVVFDGAAVVADRGSGVTLSGGWDMTPAGAMAYQLLGSYNFGSEAFWGRGRATRLLREGPSGSTRLGGEVAFLTGDGFHAIQPGAVMEWRRASGHSFGIGVGAKIPEGGNNAIYFKVEAGMPLFR